MKGLRWLLAGGLFGIAGLYWLRRTFQTNPTPNLNGAVVLITGASSGIGQALARAFADVGARLVLTARRGDLLEQVGHQITSQYPHSSVLILPADLRDSEALQHVVDTTLNHYGRIDILVNNAGIMVGGLLHTLPIETIEDTVSINLTAALTLTKLCLPAMRSQRSGWIVNISSILGGISYPFYVPYATSKHALRAFSEVLRRELDGTGVYVVTAMPSFTRTDMIAAATQQAMIESGQPLDSPQFVAARILEGLQQGQQDIYFGGLKMRAAFWLEQHFPLLMRLYFRATLTPDHIAISERA